MSNYPTTTDLVDQADRLEADGRAFLRGLQKSAARDCFTAASDDALSNAKALALANEKGLGGLGTGTIILQMQKYAAARVASQDDHRVEELAGWIDRANANVGYSVIAHLSGGRNAAWAYLAGVDPVDYALDIDAERRAMADEDDGDTVNLGDLENDDAA